MKSSYFFLQTMPALVGSSLMVAGMIALSSPAQAGTLTCPANVATNGPSASAWSACEISDTNSQDFVNGGNANFANFTVNRDNFFGHNDWLLGDRTDFEPSPLSGSWSLPSLPTTATDVMMIFKGGQSNIIGYLLNPGVTGGTFTSPLFKSETITQGVSHYTFYYRNGDSTGGNNGGNAAVPEPTTMAGLALAGVGLAAYRRRKGTAKA